MAIAEWATPEANQILIERRADGVSYNDIASELSVLLRRRVTKSMAIRRGRTLNVPSGATIINYGPYPPLTPADPLPRWGTPEAVELIRLDHSRRCGMVNIAARWGVCQSSLEYALQTKARSHHKAAVKPITSASRVLDYVRAHVEDGVFEGRFQDIAKELGITRQTVEKAFRDMVHDKQLTRLREATRYFPGRFALGGVAAPPVVRATPAPPPAPAWHRPASASGREMSVNLLRGLTNLTLRLPEPPRRRAGVCCWPLECSEPAAGRFCSHHEGLGRAAA